MTIIALCGNKFVTDMLSTCGCGKCKVAVLRSKTIVPDREWVLGEYPVVALAFSGSSAYGDAFCANEAGYRLNTGKTDIRDYLSFIALSLVDTSQVGEAVVVVKTKDGYAAYKGRSKKAHGEIKGCRVYFGELRLRRVKDNDAVLSGSGTDAHQIYFGTRKPTVETVWVAATRTHNCSHRLQVLDLDNWKMTEIETIPKTKLNQCFKLIRETALASLAEETM